MKSGFRTYVMRNERLVDVTDLVRAPPEPRVHLQTDRGYENLTVPGFEYGKEGDPAAGKLGEKGTPKLVDLSSRTKHRTYMKERGLAHYSDFTETWAAAAAKRERIRAGTDPENNRRILDTVVESVKKLEGGFRPPPPPRVEHDERDTPVVYPKE